MRRILNDIMAFAFGHSLPPGKPQNSRSQPSASLARVTAKHAQNVTELRARLNHLGISQAGFADLCHVHANTVSSWARGCTRMNGAAKLLLELMEDQAEVRRALCVGFKVKCEPRGRPFAKGNVYRFGDRRRRVAIAGSHLRRAAA